MTNYILPSATNPHHYYYQANKGILCVEDGKDSATHSNCIYKDGQDGFCVYADAQHNVHMLCSNAEGDLIYLLNKDDVWHRHTLSKANGSIFPQTIRLSVHEERINLIYSAKYKNEILLIYCILGVSSQPIHIDTLSPEHPDFFVFNTKVYYTNSDNVLGYQDFGDGRPDTFVPIAKDGIMPHVTSYDDEELLTYIENENICFNQSAVFEDKYATEPIIVSSGAKLLLLWKSINFIRYITSQNGGATWSAPMKFVNSGKSTQIFYVQTQHILNKYYGSYQNNEISILGTPSLRTLTQNTPINKHKSSEKNTNTTNNQKMDYSLEIQKLKIMLESIHRELDSIKNEIKSIKND